MFPFCENINRPAADFGGAWVTSVSVGKDKTSMKLVLSLTKPTPPADIKALEEAIACEYGLESVVITAIYARLTTPGNVEKRTSDSPAKANKVIMGRQAKGASVPMENVTLEMGKVRVTGEVCSVSSRRIEKSGAWALDFDITDYTGTLQVSKFMKDEDAGAIVKKIKNGMWLTVSGNLSINRFGGDLAIDPTGIMTAEREKRQDTAVDKRVELHLHTKMSAMDAVADTKEVILRAAEWGHEAIAITDHGVVHSFPEAAEAVSALDGKIKVIYGIEGYYVNDVDSQMAVFGDEGSPNDEFVVFDIETTGLSPTQNVIFEIGAVLVKGGKEAGRFHTFADPGTPIPHEIARLTGRSDADVLGAPSQIEAVKAFLDFAGERYLVAHNAAFDVGFLYETCLRHQIPFVPRYIDTLAMARGLLPQLKNHKLDTVARHLEAVGFNHHQADEDAGATAHIFIKLLGLLREKGITDTSQINSFLLGAVDHKARKGRLRHKHIVLLAKNQTGLNNLYKLVTKSHLEYYDRYPMVFKSELMKHREGLLIGSACQAGEVFEAVLERQSSLELLRLAEFYDYLEIQPICNNSFMLYTSKPLARDEEELRDFNRRIVEVGEQMNKPVTATGDVHFLDPEHEVFRHILLCGKSFDSADEKMPIYFRTTDEMLEEFSYLGEEKAFEVVVGNTKKISDMCECISPLPPPNKLFLPKIKKSAEELEELVYGNLRKLYGDDPPEIVAKRVETELRDILERGYDVIYMTAQKLVADALDHGYLVGARGSVGSSIVAFLAGITDVNALPAHYRCPKCCTSDFESGAGWGCGADMPDMVCPVCGQKYIKDGFNIPFETFLGFDGDKVPDIDLNFSGEYQTQAHQYTTDMFGAENVYRAGTITKIGDKTAYGYVKKYLESVGKTVTKAEENRLARGCIGVKKTTGQHPGGLIIIPQGMEITDFCPAQHPADSKEKGVITTHFDYHCMEGNLIKLDALGHDNPTMIKKLEEMTGIMSADICLGEKTTMSIFSSPEQLGLPLDDEIIGATGTIGIPEFGTGFTRQMLCDTKPENFDTLVRLSGFSHGEDVWIGNARELILSGKASVGETIGCRDDIMLFLISRGMDDRYAFKISESVRKGKGLPDGAEEDMVSYGVPVWYVESCKKMTYLFPKAHAVAYVMEAFRIAWFKVHRPLEFYSAFFYRRSQKNSFDADSMINGIERVRAKIKETRNNPEAKPKDEDILPTLEACYEFYMRGFDFEGIDVYESDPVRFLIVGENKLRPPFVAISGLGDTGAYDLAEMRVGRKFVSIDEISSVCPKVSKTHIEQLKRLGALRDLPDSSQMSLF